MNFEFALGLSIMMNFTLFGLVLLLADNIKAKEKRIKKLITKRVKNESSEV